MTPSSYIWLRFARSAALLATYVLASCASDPPAPEPRKPTAQVAAPLLTPEEKPQFGPLDAFGNLKGSGESILGFEVPLGAERNHRARAFPVVYVAANEKRLLRFYRSRGHTLIKTMRTWTVAHSHRTLSDDNESPTKVKDAKVVMTQGPGAGYTLRFHRATPAPPSKRPLELLVEAELKASKKRGTERAGAVVAEPTPPLKRLRADAFNDRPNTTKAVDLSERIYEHMKAKGGERFLD